MSAPPRPRRRRAPAPLPVATVFDFSYARILQALAARQRYKYVQPRVLRMGQAHALGADQSAGQDPGWLVVSPNCSRNIDPEGGEIPIAWLQPLADGRWRLHAHDHARGQWCAEPEDLRLADALARLSEDPRRVYWP